MKYFIDKQEHYKNIINLICKYKGITDEELEKILRDKECKYLLFLLLKKYNCVDYEILKKDFDIKSKRVLNYNLKKAEENLLINRKVRELYFEAEDIIEGTK